MHPCCAASLPQLPARLQEVAAFNDRELLEYQGIVLGASDPHRRTPIGPQARARRGCSCNSAVGMAASACLPDTPALAPHSRHRCAATAGGMRRDAGGTRGMGPCLRACSRSR
jgi:hypothetical protein